MTKIEQLTWDYKGYRDYPTSLQISLADTMQTDWNVTIVTKINYLSNLIHLSTYRGGANNIKINSGLLPLFETITYFSKSEEGMSLFGSYTVIVDDTLPKDIIVCYYETPELISLREAGFEFYTIKKGEELLVGILKTDSEEYKNALNDPNINIATEDNCRGEIKILNYYE